MPEEQLTKRSNGAFTQPASSPAVVITTAGISSDSLIVRGQNFAPGAVIIVNGRAQPSSNDEINPNTILISRKAAKRMVPGGVAILQVRNPDGTHSPDFLFYRPAK